jgi:hypothetical protein
VPQRLVRSASGPRPRFATDAEVSHSLARLALLFQPHASLCANPDKIRQTLTTRPAESFDQFGVRSSLLAADSVDQLGCGRAFAQAIRSLGRGRRLRGRLFRLGRINADRRVQLSRNEPARNYYFTFARDRSQCLRRASLFGHTASTVDLLVINSRHSFEGCNDPTLSTERLAGFSRMTLR